MESQRHKLQMRKWWVISKDNSMKNFIPINLKITHRVDTLPEKKIYNLTIQNQDENKNPNRTSKKKKKPKFKICPQKSSSWLWHFKNKFYRISEKQIILPFHDVLQRIKRRNTPNSWHEAFTALAPKPDTQYKKEKL